MSSRVRALIEASVPELSYPNGFLGPKSAATPTRETTVSGSERSSVNAARRDARRRSTSSGGNVGCKTTSEIRSSNPGKFFVSELEPTLDASTHAPDESAVPSSAASSAICSRVPRLRSLLQHVCRKTGEARPFHWIDSAAGLEDKVRGRHRKSFAIVVIHGQPVGKFKNFGQRQIQFMRRASRRRIFAPRGIRVHRFPARALSLLLHSSASEHPARDPAFREFHRRPRAPLASIFPAQKREPIASSPLHSDAHPGGR